jgi:hypothetical protein
MQAGLWLKKRKIFINILGFVRGARNDVSYHHIFRILGTICGISVRSHEGDADIGAFWNSSVSDNRESIDYYTNLMHRFVVRRLDLGGQLNTECSKAAI